MSEYEPSMLELTTGNLLEADVEALVNTVNTEGVMGKGIALQFAKKFPDMAEAYRRACKAGEVRPGRMHVFERGEMLNPRFVINFPTKRHWRAPSRMEDIEAGLAALVAEIGARGIRSVAIPPLGCGNGGLDWREVRPRIEHAFGALAGVRVLLYPPAGSPDASSIVHRTDRPAMNPSRAIVLKVWQRYFALDYQLTLLEIHKLLYFLQEAGEPLRLRFTKQTYGPYADNLRHLLHRFEGHFTLGFADGRNRPDTQIELLAGATAEADRFLSDHADQSRQSLQRLARVEDLIQGFESPYGMELLATVHWAAVHEKATEGGPGAVQEIVHDWNPRKRRLMKPEHIQLAWRQLAAQGWVA